MRLSAVSFYEIGQKVRIGKWPEMEPHVEDLINVSRERNYMTLPLTPAVALSASLLDWPHRDPFDRIIAATAMAERLPIVSPDNVFDTLGLERIWD